METTRVPTHFRTRRTHPHRLLYTVCLMLAATLVSTAALAVTFTVDSTIDAVDVLPGNGICATVGDDCTLRAAIMETNALPGADTIVLPAGTYTLTRKGIDEGWAATGEACALDTEPYVPEIQADDSEGDLDIFDSLTILGDGAPTTIVGWAEPVWPMDGDPATGDRVFHVQAVSATVALVTISGLSIVNGSVGVVPDNTPDASDPGANYNLCVVDATPGSTAVWQFRRMGGGIAIGNGAAAVLYEETVHGPGGGGGGDGGDMGPFPGGMPGDETEFGVDAVTLDHVLMAGNQSGADGGGLFNGGATLTRVEDSAISGNFSGANGGGIYNAEALEVVNTTIGTAGYIPLVTDAALLSVPNHGENGGGIFDTGSHTTTIRTSSISGNTAIGGGAIAGRALVVIDIANTTISGNTATDVGGGITTNGTALMNSVTVVDNTADTDAPGGGGGFNSFGGGTFTFRNTILSGNTKNLASPVTSNCGCSGGSTLCEPGRMISQGYNIGDDDACGFGSAGDLANTDPLLEPLANNGGPTETHALGPGSPAVDTADPITCPAKDQRGMIRPMDGDGSGTEECDIGAYEDVLYGKGMLYIIPKYYAAILGRIPDPGGFEYWIREIARIVGLGIDVHEGCIALGRVFFNSAEYIAMGTTDAQYVTDLYNAFLGRDPAAEALAFWVNFLAQGLSRDMLLTVFSYSAEFDQYMAGIFGQDTTRPEYNMVNDFYRGILNRLPDGPGFAAWVGTMQVAQCSGAEEVRNVSAQIALNFIQSPEYALRNRTNEGFVEDLYSAFLKRGAEPAGYVHWVGLLDGGTSRGDVLDFFVNSAEFQLRVDDVIAAGCI